MKLTHKLLGFLNRVFDKDPSQVLALRLQYDGAMQWTVEDGRLITSVSGGSGASLNVDLSSYTIGTLAVMLGSQPGYSVPYVDTSPVAGRSALALIDSSGNPDTSNGDHLYAYTSTLWAYIDSIASELKLAADQVVQMLHQLVIGTAEAEWLDELGSYYAIARELGEADQPYAARIIASLGRPRSNNVAIEMAINTALQGVPAKVTDVTTPTAFTAGSGGTSYGLFDVVYTVALDSNQTFANYTTKVTAIVEAFRAAGTHMRQILINGSLEDSYPISNIGENFAALNVSFADVTENKQFKVRRHDGTYRRDGAHINYYNGDIVYDGSNVYGWTPGSGIPFDSGAEELTITITDGSGTHPPETI